MQFEAGNYTGNATNRTITLNEITATPDLVICDQDTGKYPNFRITGMTNSQRIDHASVFTTAITALSAGSFDLGTSTDVNNSGSPYTYLAIYDDGNDDFAVGTYTGDGNATQTISTGLSDLEQVWVFQDTSATNFWHCLSMGGTTKNFRKVPSTGRPV